VFSLFLVSKEDLKHIEEISKILKIKSKVTDFAKVLHCTNYEYYLQDGLSNKSNSSIDSLNIGVRVALDYREIQKVITLKKNLGLNVIEASLGEYPCSVPGKALQKELAHACLEETGRFFHVNGQTNQFSFTLHTLIEYRYQNHCYVILNGVFVEVKPVDWILFCDLGIAVTKDIIFSGINYKDLNFFFQNYLSHELFSHLFYSRDKEIYSRLDQIQFEKSNLMNEERALLFKLQSKSDEERLQEIDHEYFSVYGVHRFEFEEMLRKLCLTIKGFESKKYLKRLSILENLQVLLLYGKGVSLQELSKDYELNETYILENIDYTRKKLLKIT